MFLDGSQLTATTSSFTIPTTATKASIGAYSLDDSPIYEFKGTISNLRIVKGSAVYTSNFTVPSTPLSNITNTKLLCCQSNTTANAAAVTPGSVTVNGDTKATNFNPFNTDANTVRGQEGGYDTLNPLSSQGGTLSDGNLTYSGTNNNFATIGVTSGKWFWEVRQNGTLDNSRYKRRIGM